MSVHLSVCRSISWSHVFQKMHILKIKKIWHDATIGRVFANSRWFTWTFCSFSEMHYGWTERLINGWTYKASQSCYSQQKLKVTTPIWPQVELRLTNETQTTKYDWVCTNALFPCFRDHVFVFEQTKQKNKIFIFLR